MGAAMLTFTGVLCLHDDFSSNVPAPISIFGFTNLGSAKYEITVMSNDLKVKNIPCWHNSYGCSGQHDESRLSQNEAANVTRKICPAKNSVTRGQTFLW